MLVSRLSEIEENVINEMKSQSYHYQNSREYNWLLSIFEERPDHNILQSLCMFLANRVDVRISYQHCMRKETCYFWIHKHYEEIQNYLSNHTVSIECENSERIYLVPDVGFQAKPIPSVTIFNENVQD